MSKTQKRCVIYTRCASAHIKGEAILEQEKQCHAYIKNYANNGWVFVEKIYRDNGVSGMSLNHLGLNQLIDDAKKQKFDYIVMTCPSRLSRQLRDFEYIHETLFGLGIEIHYAQNEVEDIATPFSQGAVYASALHKTCRA